MLRAMGASAIAFCTFFITPVSASYDRPVDMREVVSASWDLLEVSEQLGAEADADGQAAVARAAEALRQEAKDWYAAVRALGAERLAKDEIPAAHEEMRQAFADLAGWMDAADAAGASAKLKTLWRMTRSRMAAASQVAGLQDAGG